ncbi:sugar isomerase [Wenyingzhuangia sp. IMCC45533]
MKSVLAYHKRTLSQEHIFMLSVLVVNGGNYLYNLLLGRLLGPEQFSDAAILITLLLVLSFVAMTFQLVVARFSVTIKQSLFSHFLVYVLKKSLIVGFVLGIAVVAFSKQLQVFFNTSSSTMFVIFGCGIPLYFLMSVNRGFFQGAKEFIKLSISYQLEMLTRLSLTLALIYILKTSTSNIIAIGIMGSLLIGVFPMKFNLSVLKQKAQLPSTEVVLIKKFFIITAFYELTQIIINNSDILLVKHYFDTYNAGLYASLALIGRVVYFIAWMFVMLLLPTVVQLKKEGKSTTKVLLKYVFYISIIGLVIVTVCKLYPVFIIQVLFGDSYVSMAPLLWRYALATSVFAVANIFSYYYLSLDKYIPVVVSGLFGVLQLLLIVLNHSTLLLVVNMQIYAMVLLLIFQLGVFYKMNQK